jgi:hypothetical protein
MTATDNGRTFDRQSTVGPSVAHHALTDCRIGWRRQPGGVARSRSSAALVMTRRSSASAEDRIFADHKQIAAGMR